MGVVVDKIRGLVGIRTHTYDTPVITIRGIDTSDAHEVGDAIGPQFFIPLPFRSAILQAATLFDRDGETAQLNLVLSKHQFASPIADDDAYNPGDDDLDKEIKTLEFTTTITYTNGRKCELDSIGRSIEFAKHNGKYGVWTQLYVPSGTPQFAAGKEPQFYLSFLADE